MAQNNRNERISRQYDSEQPEGWFDPQQFSRERNTGSGYRSRMQNTNYGAGRGSGYNASQGSNYDSRNRYGSGYSSGYGNMEGSRLRNYGNRNYEHSQFENTGDNYSRGYNSDPNDTYNSRPSHKPFYGDNFEWETRIMNQGDQYNLRSSGDDEDRFRAYPGDRRVSDREHDRDRDWWDRASDEVASWFGDDEAERRRRMDKRMGPHRGKGPKGYSRTDERVSEDINQRLYDDPFIDASDIEVKVENGEAILTGTVESREAKRRIEDIAESITGVKDVENRLKVRSRTDNFSDRGERGEGSSWTH